MSSNSRTMDLKTRFLVDTKQGIKGIRHLKNEVKSLFTISSDNKKENKGGFFSFLFGGGSEGKKQIPTIGGMISNLKQKILNIKPAFIVAAAGAAIFLSAMTSVVDAGRQTEDAITRLYVMYKRDMPRALEDYNKALTYSVATPFDPRDAVEGLKVLTSYGADKVGNKDNMLRLVGDMAAYSGQTMGEAATALMRADIALLDKYGMQGRQAYNAAKKKGKLGSKEFVTEFVQQMSSTKMLWSGMAKEMSETVSGLFSTMKGNAGLIWTYLSGAAEGRKAMTFWNSFRAILKDLSNGFSDIVASLKPLLIDLGAAIGGIFEAVWSVLKAIWTVIKPVAQLVGGVLYAAFRGILKVIIYIARFLKWFFDGVAAFAKWVYTWLDNTFGISDSLKKIVTWFENAVGLLKGLWVFVFRLVEPVIEKIKELFNWIMKTFNSINKAIGDMVEKQMKGLMKTRKGRAVVDVVTGTNLSENTFSGTLSTDKFIASMIKLSKTTQDKEREQLKEWYRKNLFGKSEVNTKFQQDLEDKGKLEEARKTYNKYFNNSGNKTTIINNHSEKYPSYIERKKKGDLSGSLTEGYGY